MTDFVNRLLGRSTVPSIRPLLPTLFEPTRREEPDDLSPGIFTPSLASVSSVAPVHHHHLHRGAMPATPVMPLVAAPTGPQETANHSAVHDDVAPGPAVERCEVVHSTTAVTDITETSIILSHTEVVTPVALKPSEPTPQEPAPTEPHHITDPPTLYRVAQPPVPQRAESPRRQPVKPRRSSREPDVHVTIGRVEIRADAAKSAGVQRIDESRRRPRLSLRGLPPGAGELTMSDARAIEGVTATLLQIVDDAVNKGPQAFPGGVKVVAQPPHEVQTDMFALQVNLFLYRTEIAAGLRNEDPIDARAGESTQPPLPLVLHYLITPYVQNGRDIDAHRLLGLAARAVHEQSLLSQTQLSDSSGSFSNVSTQLDRIRITWQPLAENDIYSLWSAFQTPYRLSAAFEVRAVLIDGREPPRAPVPVLRRGAGDEGPVAIANAVSPLPELEAVVLDSRQAAAQLGELVRLQGHNLAGQVQARLTHPLVAAPLTVPATSVTDTEITITLPALPTAVPAGLWGVVVDVTNTVDAQPVTLTTNALPLSVAPRITSPMPLTVARDAQQAALISLTCEPEVVAGQSVFLIVDGRAIPEQRALTGTTVDGAALSFLITDAPLGDHLLRLRVAGVDSRFIDKTQAKPQFDTSQKVTVTP